MPENETRADLFRRIHNSAVAFIRNAEQRPQRFIPRSEIEGEIARAAHDILDALARLDALGAAEGSNLPIRIERAMRTVGTSVSGQLDRWGWRYPGQPDGLKILETRLERHHIEKERPLLQAVRTWREAPDVERHGMADRMADRARALGIPPDPALTPDEAKELTWQRQQAWSIGSIALETAGENPADADQAVLDAMRPYVDDIGAMARQLESEQQRGDVLSRARAFVEARSRAENPQAAEPENGADAEPESEGFIPFAEARAMTGVESYTLSRACTAGHIRSVGQGKARRVNAADLARWIKQRNVK